MTPATYNFSVVLGSAGVGQGLTVRLKNVVASVLTNMVFDDVRLTVNSGTTLLFRATLSGADGIVISDAGEAEVTWIPTLAHTRALKVGAKQTYELEVRKNDPDGFEAVYLIGTITGIGGINDDAP